MSTEDRRIPEIWKHLRLIRLCFVMNLSAAMEYRVSFITQVFGMMLNDLAFLFFWWILFQRIGNLNGYTLKDVMFIWALTAASFGFAHIVFGNIPGVAGAIINGELDVYILQPKNIYINLLCARTNIGVWGDLIYGYVLVIAAYGFQPLKILLFVLFTILGGLLMGSIITMAHSLTFFLGNSSAVSRIVTEFLLNFSLYPESIFKGYVRWLFYSLIPTGFAIFMPLRLFKLFSWHGLLLVLAVDCLYIFLGYRLFNLGLKRYESGNLITARM